MVCLATASIQTYGSVTSTMDVARHLSTTNPQPFAVLAGEQLSGRGRLDGDWQSPKGNLYTSICFKPQLAPQHLALSSFAVVLALFDCVKALETQQTNLKVKWPNDLLLDGQKVAGLLLECLPNGTLIVGLGVNLKSSPVLTNKAYKAANLSTCIEVGPADFLSLYLKKLEHWISKLEDDGFDALRKTWLNHAYGIGQVARVRLAKEEVEGTIQGIDQHGQLLLSVANAPGQPAVTRTITAGSVFF